MSRGSSRREAPDAAPLVLTLALDAHAQRVLDALRQAHFPPERNHLAAHLTLFHALPGRACDRIAADLAGISDGTAPLALVATGPIPLGRGVAIAIDAPGLRAVRDDLVRRWETWLGPQDRQIHRPHVTVQNKVEPDVARALHAELGRTFVPFPATGTGLSLWRYLGGPWEPVDTFPFRG